MSAHLWMIAGLSLFGQFQTADTSAARAPPFDLRTQLERFNDEPLTVGQIRGIAWLWAAFGHSMAPYAESLILDTGSETKARHIAKEMFVWWGDSASLVLSKHLGTKDAHLLAEIVELLGNMGAKRHMNELIKLRSHKDVYVRRRLIEALAKFQDRRAVLALLDFVWNETDENNRDDALVAMSGLGLQAAEAIPSIAELQALLRLGPDATQFLGKLLQDPKYASIHKTVFFAMGWDPPEFRTTYANVVGRGASLKNRTDLRRLVEQYLANPLDDAAIEQAKLALRMFDGGEK
jgi:hypothetical protein